jgi:ribosomal protein S18 acetylase RimI-like enzyme
MPTSSIAINKNEIPHFQTSVVAQDAKIVLQVSDMPAEKINFKINVRDARPEELDRIAALLQEAYQQYRDFMPPEVWQAYLENILDLRSRWKEAQLIVAESGSELAGAVTLYLKTDSSEGGWPEGWAGVRLLGVDPKYRGQGVGRALMDECVKRCKKQDLKTIGLHTTELMDIAKRMYERMGFTRVPEFDFHPRPGVTVMAYKLDL